MTVRKKEAGNVGEILTIGLCILALTALMISYMENVQLIAKKAEVGQLARCYLLKMETVGYLAAQDQTQLTAELENLGMTGIDYEGSTLNPAGYGNDVVLQIHGRLGETYEIYEKRVSTAKNERTGAGFLGAWTVPDIVFGNTVMYAAAGCFVQRICHVYGRCPGTVESGLGCHRYRRIRHYAKSTHNRSRTGI